MAWTTPGTATAGNVLTAAFWNTQVRDNMIELAPFMAAWTTYTPQTDQGVTNITTSTNVGRYVKVGKLVIAQFRIGYSGAGTAGQPVRVSLPVTAEDGLMTVGSGWFYDNSTVTRYMCSFEGTTTSLFGLNGDWSGASNLGQSPNIGIASGDQLRGHLIYEAD